MRRNETRARLGRFSVAISSVGTVVLAALIPKCPLCVAAALSAWGVGAAAASAMAPAVRPIAMVLMAVATLTLGLFAVRQLRNHARRTAVAGSCCATPAPRSRSG
jgi:hypothetical protein